MAWLSSDGMLRLLFKGTQHAIMLVYTAGIVVFFTLPEASAFLIA
jgi:hypothetical protein